MDSSPSQTPPSQRKVPAGSSSNKKRPKMQKSLSTPGGVNASLTTGRGGRGSRGSGRGGGRGSRGGTGRKSSNPRKSSLQTTSVLPEQASGSNSAAATPAPTIPSIPSTPRDFSVPPTPRGEYFEFQTTTSPENALLEEKEKSGKEEADDEEEEHDEFAIDLDLHMQAQLKRSKEELRALLENFSEEQLQRYEVYRRSSLSKPNVKRLVGQVLNQPCSPTMAFVIAGFTKVYIGEIIELAREVQKDWNQSGALTPEQLQEANRRYKKESGMVLNHYQKRLFRNQ
ncbi:hypothetical protein G9A89_019555 [Geosiphon pyriformis]|nr:hypothetical protein G9A89_019555 [Geosiphon pyriformis]